jgi:hypothetical protein
MAFFCCHNLTHIVIPDSVQSIGDYAFYGCASLLHIRIPQRFQSDIVRIFWNVDLSKVNLRFI